MSAFSGGLMMLSNENIYDAFVDNKVKLIMRMNSPEDH